MSDQDSKESMSEEVEELLDRAANAEPAPSEARHRVWSRVSESVEAGLDGGDDGDAGDDGGAPDGGSPGDGGLGASADGAAISGGASTAASGGGLGGMLGGAGLVQTAVSFLIGTAVGAGGYATLQTDDSPDPSDSTPAVATADASSTTDTAPPVDTSPDTGLPDAGSPDTSSGDVARIDTGESKDDGSPDPGRPDRTDEQLRPPEPEERSSNPSAPDSTANDAGPRSDADVEPTPDVTSSLSEERVVLSRAQSAMARNRPEEALDALREHRKAFPNGQLVEERRALTIRALLQVGRRDEARRRAREFLDDHPNSIFRESVEPALE